MPLPTTSLIERPTSCQRPTGRAGASATMPGTGSSMGVVLMAAPNVARVVQWGMDPHHTIALVGFDGDDTLWRSQDFYDEAQATFERMLRRYVDLGDARVQERLYAVEKGNIAFFGYGVKGMVLSMIEAAVELTGERIAAADVHRIVQMGKELLRHPVELLP